jgi:hypothetical protein
MNWQQLVVGFLLAISAYFVVRYFNTDSFTNWDSVAAVPARAPPIEEPIPRGNMAVSSSGPNPPNMAAPSTMPAKVNPPPKASDPYDGTNADANAPEQITHPERNFSPGLVPEQTKPAVYAGIANSPAESAQAFQTFNPEFVQNGGVYFGTVSAQEDENPNYSAF